jgi:hypothetical protein
LTIVLSVLLFFSFDHCIVCPSLLFFWPLYCLSFSSFLLTIVLSDLLLFDKRLLITSFGIFKKQFHWINVRARKAIKNWESRDTGNIDNKTQYEDKNTTQKT